MTIADRTAQLETHMNMLNRSLWKVGLNNAIIVKLLDEIRPHMQSERADIIAGTRNKIINADEELRESLALVLEDYRALLLELVRRDG